MDTPIKFLYCACKNLRLVGKVAREACTASLSLPKQSRVLEYPFSQTMKETKGNEGLKSIAQVWIRSMIVH